MNKHPQKKSCPSRPGLPFSAPSQHSGKCPAWILQPLPQGSFYPSSSGWPCFKKEQDFSISHPAPDCPLQKQSPGKVILEVGMPFFGPASIPTMESLSWNVLRIVGHDYLALVQELCLEGNFPVKPC